MKPKHYIGLIFFLSIILGLQSCHKEIVEIPESNNPLFTMSGTIGTSPVNYVVGDNASFTYSKDLLNGVNFFSGTLKHDDFEMEIGFFDSNADRSTSVSEILSLTSLKYAEMPYQSMFYVTKDFFDNRDNIKEIKFYVNGEYLGTNALSINTPGKYQVCAEFLYNDNSTQSICNEVIVGFKKSACFGLQFNFNVQTGTLVSWADASEGTVASVNWYLEDQLISSAENLTTQLPFGIHHIKAEITFTNGSKRTRSILVDASGQHKSIEDFAINENFTQVKWDYHVKVSYKELNNEYSSIFAENDDSSFKINSISFFDYDASGNPVYILDGTLKTKLISKITNEVKEIDLKISWGLVIK